jgi:hypothetical protein
LRLVYPFAGSRMLRDLAIERVRLFVERLWHNVEGEAAHLKAYGSVSGARHNLARHSDCYNPCEALGFLIG